MPVGVGITTGLIVDDDVLFWLSAIWYLIGVAVPVNVGTGSKVTVPFALSV